MLNENDNSRFFVTSQPARELFGKKELELEVKEANAAFFFKTIKSSQEGGHILITQRLLVVEASSYYATRRFSHLQFTVSEQGEALLHQHTTVYLTNSWICGKTMTTCAFKNNY